METQHYYSKQINSPLDIKKISQKISGTDFDFYTASGIFSKDRIDKGTLLLAENMIVSKISNVLDIGCGIGILGIAAAKLFDANVVMTEINKRAVMLAKMNVKLNNLKAEVYQGNLYGPLIKNNLENHFDVILSNPPQSAGKEICFELIEQSKNYLKNNGSLQIVARHNKGGKTLSSKMQDIFGNLKVIAKKSGYWVYISIKE